MFFSVQSAQGPHLYFVCDHGERLKGRLFSVGSGSMFAYGVVDEGYKRLVSVVDWPFILFVNSELSVREAVELAARAIYQAAHRDAYSGGCINIYHVHKDGWTKMIHAKDVNELHLYYAQEKGVYLF